MSAIRRIVWYESLKIGQQGEALFAARYPKLRDYRAMVGDPKAVDFITPSGMLVELKTENWSNWMRNRDKPGGGNIFMETLSRKERNEPGGPWQAQAKGATYFVHMFVERGEVRAERWFSVPHLVEFLDSMDYVETRTIEDNNGGTTWGKLAPTRHLDQIVCLPPRDLLWS